MCLLLYRCLHEPPSSHTGHVLQVAEVTHGDLHRPQVLAGMMTQSLPILQNHPKHMGQDAAVVRVAGGVATATGGEGL